MTKTNNEILTTVNTTTGELLQTNEQVIEDNNKYTIYKQIDGKFRKEMKYTKYHSKIPVTDEEVRELYKVFNSQDDAELVTPMGNLLNQEIEIVNVYINPYESFDEETGRNSNGVVTIIETIENGYIATSSKSVYYTVLGLLEVFGHPNIEGYTPIKVKIKGKKMQNGTQINLELV